jgi:hypothetical protein
MSITRGPRPSGAVLSSSHVRLKWTALVGLLWSFEAVFYSPFSFFFFIAVSYRETVPAFRCIAPPTNLYQSTLLLPFLLSSTAKLVAFACQNSETVWCLWTPILIIIFKLHSTNNIQCKTVFWLTIWVSYCTLYIAHCVFVLLISRTSSLQDCAKISQWRWYVQPYGAHSYFIKFSVRFHIKRLYSQPLFYFLQVLPGFVLSEFGLPAQFLDQQF